MHCFETAEYIKSKTLRIFPSIRGGHWGVFNTLLLLLQYFSRKLHSQQGDFQAGPTISIKIQIKLHYNSIYKKYV
jgi:hypothetical protein